MKKNFYLGLLCIVVFTLLCCVGNCQTTVVSGNITDSTSTVWTQSNVQLTFVPSPNQPNLGIYNINGVPLNPANLNLSVNADNSGNFSFPSVYDVKQVTPTGSSWTLTITPNASVTPTQVTGLQVTGATFNITSTISANIKPPAFPATYSPLAAHGYNDAEVSPTPLPGGAYFNVTLQQLRIWTGFAWISAAGGSGSVVAPPAFAVQFANSGVTNLTADPSFTFNTTTKAATAPIVNATSNCTIYAGATSDVRVKACLTAQQSISALQGSKMYDPEVGSVQWLTDPLRQLFGTKTGGSLELGAAEYDLSDEFVIPNLYTVFGQGKGGNQTGCPGACTGGVNTILKAVGIQAICNLTSLTYTTAGNQINAVYSSACPQTPNSKVVLFGVPKGNIWYGSYTVTTVTDSTHAVWSNNGAAHANNDTISTFQGFPLGTRKTFIELGDTINATGSQINRLSGDCNSTIGLIGLHSNVAQEFAKFNEVSMRNCYGIEFYFDKNPNSNVANIDPTGSEGLFLAAEATAGTITVSRLGTLSQIVIPNTSFQADGNGANAGVPTATPMDTFQIENFNEPNLNQASTFNGIYEILNYQLNTPVGSTTYYFQQEVGSGAVFPTPVFTGNNLTSFSGTTCTGTNPIVCVLNSTTGTGYGFPPYVTQTGGTCSTAPIVTAQANKSPGAVAILRITNQGNCTVPPTFGFSTDNIAGVTGGQFYSGTPLKVNEAASYIRGLSHFTLNAGNSSTPQAAACIQMDASGDLSSMWCQAARNEFVSGINSQPISITTHNLGGSPINNAYRIVYRIANGQAANLFLERENVGSSTSGMIDEFSGTTRPESIMPFYSFGVGLNNYAGVFMGIPVIQAANARELDFQNPSNTTLFDFSVDDNGNAVVENRCDYTVNAACHTFVRPSAGTSGAPNASALDIDAVNARFNFYRQLGDIAFGIDANHITVGRHGILPDFNGTFAMLEHFNCNAGVGPGPNIPDSVHFLAGNCNWLIPPGSIGGGPGLFPDGTAGAPGISWTNESTSGWHRNATNDFAMSINSADLIRYLGTASKAQIMSSAADLCWGSSGTGTIDFCFHRFAANSIRAVTSISGSTVANFADGTHTATLYATTTVCSQTASPAACGAATAGKVQVAAAATTLQINSTTFTANTGCWFTYDVNGITAPTNIASMIPPYISAKSAGASITITLPVAPATNPVNIQFGCNN